MSAGPSPNPLPLVTPENRAPKLTPDQKAEIDPEGAQLLTLLRGYLEEARAAREGGYNPRNQAWEDNMDSYWMRRDWTEKLDWQAKETSPAVPNFVERFAASLRQALTMIEDWFKIEDPADPDAPMGNVATKFVRLMLENSGTNATGQPIRFEKGFGDMCRTGALMAMCASVKWEGGRLRIELVDPRDYFPDPTGRGLYRVRIIPIDKDKLLKMADEVDSAGKPLYDKEAIEAETVFIDGQQQTNREQSSGAAQENSNSNRKPMILWEFLCDLVDREGKPLKEKQLVVVLNERVVIRGPEDNPFWHGQDWIVYHPMMAAPLGAIDGRTYVEHFRRLAETFENCTNLILDAVTMNAMNAFETNPEVLMDPEDLKLGVYPNKTFIRDPDADPRMKAIEPIQLGHDLGPEIFNVWQSLRGELLEGAGQSELSLGQTVSGETTATEASLSQSSQSQLINSVASDIEDGFLSVILLLAWYTGLQHLDDDTIPDIKSGLSPEQFQMLMARRDDFRQQTFRFKAKGISSMLERSQRLRGLLGALNVVGGNPLLAQAFQKDFSLTRLVSVLLEDFSVDLDRIRKSAEEKAAEAAAPPPPPGGPGQPGTPPTAQNQGGPDPLLGGLGVDTNVN